MKNLDAIINQLANEQLRTEALLVEDLKGIKKEAQLFFDKQAREADAYMALLSTRFDDLLSRIENGYPKNERKEPIVADDPVPSFLLKPKLKDDQLKELENVITESVKK